MGIAGGLDATYCEGWDPQALAVVDPLPSSVARARDERGEQYAVVFSAGDRAVGLLELAWRQYFAASWLFDEAGRRTLKVEYRLLDDDRLVRLRSEEWRYEDQHGEFDSSAWHRQCDYDLHGSVD